MNLESGIWNLESGIWNLESGIVNGEYAAAKGSKKEPINQKDFRSRNQNYLVIVVFTFILAMKEP